jgi:hypothetical protein
LTDKNIQYTIVYYKSLNLGIMMKTIIKVSQEFADEYVGSIVEPRLSKAGWKLLTAILDVNHLNGGKPGDEIEKSAVLAHLEEGRKTKYSKAWATKYFTELVDKQIAVKTVRKDPGLNRTTYFISKFSNILNTPIKKRRLKRHSKDIALRAELASEGGKFIKSTDNKHARHITDGLFMGILDCGMRTSSADYRKEIVTDMQIGGYGTITVTTRTRTGEHDEIAMLSDLRLLRNLLHAARSELIKRQFDLERSLDHKKKSIEPKDLKNSYSLSLKDMAEDLKLKASGKDLDFKAVHAMLLRLYATDYEVNAQLSPWFKSKFSPNNSDIYNFRVINSLDTLLHPDDESSDLLPRYFTFSFNDRLHDALTSDVCGSRSERNDENILFNAHAGLIIEKADILQRWYNWARIYYGSTSIKKSLENKHYTMSELLGKLGLNMRLDNFKRSWLNVVVKKTNEQRSLGNEVKLDKENSFTALIHGFYVTLSKKEVTTQVKDEQGRSTVKSFSKEWLTNIQRDPQDRIVGYDSIHNRLNREKKKEMADKAEGKGAVYSE